MKTNIRMRSALKIVIPLIVALISMFGLSQTMSKPETYKKTIASLDEKKATVTALATASTTASVLITTLTDDVATPLANELADLSSCFLIILTVIYLEKYLLTIIGLVTFRILIPVVCVIFMVNQRLQSETFRVVMKKIVIVGLVFMCVIPVSEKVSCLIHETYSASIEETMELAQQEISIESDEEGGISGIFSKIKDGASDLLDWGKNILNNFIEAIAIMVVTTCVIPILVLLFLLWFIKYILGLNINLPKREDLMLVKKGVHKLKDIREMLDDSED